MSALLNGHITLEKLKEIIKTVEAKKAKGFGFTISINDETNQWGQNASMFAEQSKEDRQAKKEKWYCGNGKVIWTDGKIVKAEQQQAKQGSYAPNNNPPF